VEHTRTMTLHFNDGSKLDLEFPEQAQNSLARQVKLAEFLASKHLVVEAEGSLLIVPVTSVKYIALSATESSGGTFAALPKHAIRGARIRG